MAQPRRHSEAPGRHSAGGVAVVAHEAASLGHNAASEPRLGGALDKALHPPELTLLPPGAALRGGACALHATLAVVLVLEGARRTAEFQRASAPAATTYMPGSSGGPVDGHAALRATLRHSRAREEAWIHAHRLRALEEEEAEQRDRMLRLFASQQRRFFVPLLDEFHAAVRPHTAVMRALCADPHNNALHSRRANVEVGVLKLIATHSTTLTTVVP